ncbi:hypothetical protein C0992_006603 [Termitomyces sp. T32_za158]|nr:hypothetical protein C0992_006603 [Termitomyces sp. T32_za158]
MAGKLSSAERLSSVTTATSQVPKAHKTPGFFSWILPALKNPGTLKTLVRCCAALAATLILMVSNRTLDSMGQAGFFAASIVAVMLPPSMALSLFLLAAVTFLLGMCMGWAWGVVAMAAGLSVRSQALLAQQQQKAQASLVDGIPQALQFQKFIFEGYFLDPRSSAVYGVFFFIGTFALGVLRAYIPKFTLVSIFGNVLLWSLISDFQLHSRKNLLDSNQLLRRHCHSLTRFDISCVPEPRLDPLSKILTYQTKALESLPSDHATWTELTTLTQATRQRLLASTQGLLGQIGVVDLEFSVGRLGPGDLKRISQELKSIVFRTSALYSFLEFVNRSNTAYAANDEADSVADNKMGYWDRYTILQKELWQHEIKHGHDFDSLVPILAESSYDLRAACNTAITGLIEWFSDCNDGRWTKLFSKYNKVKGDQRHAVLVQQLAAVQRELEQYRELHRIKVFQPYEKFFDPLTGQRLKQSNASDTTEMFAARSLYICLVFSFSLDAFAGRLANLMSIIIDMDSKRPKPRIWAPSGFGKLGRKIMSRRDIDRQVVPLAIGTSHDPTSFENHIDNDEDEDEKVQVIFDDKCTR